MDYLLLNISYRDESSSSLEELTNQLKDQNYDLDVDSLALPNRNDPDNYALLMAALKRNTQKARELNLTLHINTFQPFEGVGSRDLLLLLKQSGVKFRFEDFPGLEQENIDILLDFLERKERSRGEAIKERLSSQKKAGKLGNPKLVKSGIQHLGILQKLKNSFLDENNRLAREIIFNLKSEELSDSKIAQELNDKGYLTRNNKRFSPTTVKRLYEAQLELNKLFEINQKEWAACQKASEESKGPELPVNLPHFSDFENTIQIEFEQPVPVSVKLEIFNNKREKVWEHKYAAGESLIEIDFLKEPSLLPGLHFFYFLGAKSKEILDCFPAYFRKDLSAKVHLEDPSPRFQPDKVSI